MRSTVHSLFPTLVWEAQLAPEAYAPLNEAILRRLAELRQGDVAAGGGW